MKKATAVSLACLLCLALAATGQEKKPAPAPTTKKKPPTTPTTEKPATEKPAAEKPATEKPAVKTPVAEEPAAEEPPSEKPAAETEEITAVLRSYRDAFNKHDVAALAALWSPQGVYVDRATGERMTGSKAIAADFEASFKVRPALQLTASVSGIRFIKPDVAVVEGHASSSEPDEEPGAMNFSAILVNQDGKWLIDSIEETTVATPETPYDALKDLEWMVGHWVDESEDVSVNTTVRWSANRSFLIRSYSIELADEDSREGTQVIGWDPIERRIRSWNFDSDGSFGEGAWFKNGDVWMSRISATLADGSTASGTQIYTRNDDDSYTVEMVGRETDGEPVPSTGAVNVIRVAEQAAADRAEDTDQASE